MKYGGLNEEKNGDPNKRLFTKAVAYLSDPIKKAAKSAGCLVAGASMLTGSGVFGQTFANPALFYGGANASLDLVMGMETAFGGISGMEGIYGGMLMEETILHLDRPEAMLIGLVLECHNGERCDLEEMNSLAESITAKRTGRGSIVGSSVDDLWSVLEGKKSSKGSFREALAAISMNLPVPDEKTTPVKRVLVQTTEDDSLKIMRDFHNSDVYFFNKNEGRVSKISADSLEGWSRQVNGRIIGPEAALFIPTEFAYTGDTRQLLQIADLGRVDKNILLPWTRKYERVVWEDVNDPSEFHSVFAASPMEDYVKDFSKAGRHEVNEKSGVDTGCQVYVLTQQHSSLLFGALLGNRR